MRFLTNALLGLGIMILGWVPPGLHWVTGPLGPAIGGLIAGMRLRANLEQAMAVAGLMTGLLFVVVAVIFAIAVELLPLGVREIDSALLFWLGVAFFLFVFLLATVGAWIGGALARRSEPTAHD